MKDIMNFRQPTEKERAAILEALLQHMSGDLFFTDDLTAHEYHRYDSIPKSINNYNDIDGMLSNKTLNILSSTDKILVPVNDEDKFLILEILREDFYDTTKFFKLLEDLTILPEIGDTCMSYTNDEIHSLSMLFTKSKVEDFYKELISARIRELTHPENFENFMSSLSTENITAQCEEQISCLISKYNAELIREEMQKFFLNDIISISIGRYLRYIKTTSVDTDEYSKKLFNLLSRVAPFNIECDYNMFITYEYRTNYTNTYNNYNIYITDIFKKYCRHNPEAGILDTGDYSIFINSGRIFKILYEKYHIKCNPASIKSIQYSESRNDIKETYINNNFVDIYLTLSNNYGCINKYLSDEFNYQIIFSKYWYKYICDYSNIYIALESIKSYTTNNNITFDQLYTVGDLAEKYNVNKEVLYGIANKIYINLQNTTESITADNRRYKTEITDIIKFISKNILNISYIHEEESQSINLNEFLFGLHMLSCENIFENYTYYDFLELIDDTDLIEYKRILGCSELSDTAFKIVNMYRCKNIGSVYDYNKRIYTTSFFENSYNNIIGIIGSLAGYTKTLENMLKASKSSIHSVEREKQHELFISVMQNNASSDTVYNIFHKRECDMSIIREILYEIFKKIPSENSMQRRKFLVELRRIFLNDYLNIKQAGDFLQIFLDELSKSTIRASTIRAILEVMKRGWGDNSISLFCKLTADDILYTTANMPNLRASISTTILEYTL